MRTVQFETSRKTLASGVESGPGFSNPVMFLPSQFITTVIAFLWVAVGPQSPDQVPVSGCPCCPEATKARQAHSSNTRLRMHDSFRSSISRYSYSSTDAIAKAPSEERHSAGGHAFRRVQIHPRRPRLLRDSHGLARLPMVPFAKIARAVQFRQTNQRGFRIGKSTRLHQGRRIKP